MAKTPTLPLPEDPAFDAWVASLPKDYWAKYDLNACHLGWEAHKSYLAGELLGAIASAATAPVTDRLPFGEDTMHTKTTIRFVGRPKASKGSDVAHKVTISGRITHEGARDALDTAGYLVSEVVEVVNDPDVTAVAYPQDEGGSAKR